MEKTDEETILECQDGNKEAFKGLVDKYASPLYNFTARLAGRENAADLSQETFFKAWKNLKRFDAEKASFKTWLFSIARNTATDFLRKKKSPVLSEFRDGEDLMVEIPDESLLPDEALQKIEDADSLNKLLDKLPVNYRMILTLYYQEEMTFREIGEIMDKPLNTIKSSHRRAIIALRNML